MRTLLLLRRRGKDEKERWERQQDGGGQNSVVAEDAAACWCFNFKVDGREAGGVCRRRSSARSSSRRRLSLPVRELPISSAKGSRARSKRQKTQPARFDALFALTHSLKMYYYWMNDNEYWGEGEELEQAIKALAPSSASTRS